MKKLLSSLTLLCSIMLTHGAEAPSMAPAEKGATTFNNGVIEFTIEGIAAAYQGITHLRLIPAASDMIDRNRTHKNLLGENWDTMDVNGVQGGRWFPHNAVYAPLAKGSSKDGFVSGMLQEYRQDYRLTRNTELRRGRSVVEIRYEVENIDGKPMGGAFRFFSAFFPGALTGTTHKSTSVFMPTENGIIEIDQNIHGSEYKTLYKDTRYFNDTWTNEPLRSWTRREVPTPKLTGNWTAEVNRNNGSGVVIFCDSDTLVGFYNDPRTTLETVTKAFSLNKKEKWNTALSLGVFRLPKNAKMIDANQLFVSCESGIIPLFEGTFEIDGKAYPASPVKLIAIKSMESARAMDMDNALIGTYEKGVVTLTKNTVDYIIPPKPWFWGKIYDPEQTGVAKFLEKRDYTLYCGYTNHPDIKSEAKRIALRLGVGYSEMNPGGKLLAIGSGEDDEIIRNIGYMQNSVTNVWPEKGEGAIRYFPKLELTADSAVLVTGRDLKGLQRTLKRWESEYLKKLEPVSGWRLATVPNNFRAFPYSRPDESAKQEIKIRAAKGEYESAQLLIVANESLKNIGASVSEFINEKTGQALSKKFISHTRRINGHSRVRWVGLFPYEPKPGTPFYPDPIFDRSPSILEAGQAQGIWLTFMIPETAEAGIYKAEVCVSANGEERKIPIELTVRDFVLPRDGMMGEAYAHLGAMSPKGKAINYSHVETYVRNLLEHGMRMIRIHSPGLFRTHHSVEGAFKGVISPSLEVSDDGKIMLDCSEFDRIIERSEIAGVPFDFKYTISLTVEDFGNPARELQRIFPERHEKRDGNALLNNRYVGELLTLYRKHLEKRGWLDKFYLGVSDEPGNIMTWYNELCQAAVDAKLKFTTAHGSADLTKAPPGLASIWKPIYGSYDPEFMEKARAAGSLISFYNCGPPPTTAIGAPMCEWRNYLWQAAKYDLDMVSWWGIQCWTNYEMDGNEALWRNYYGHWNYLIYPEHPVKKAYNNKGWKDTRFIDSIRWETIRDGMEDTKYVTLLRRLIAKAREQKLNDDANTAQSKLDNIFNTLYPHLNAYRATDEQIAESREIIADTIIELQKKVK